MKARLAYLTTIALSWQLLPTALVRPGENPSLVGFLSFGMLYTLGFSLTVWLLGLWRRSLEGRIMTLMSAWMTSAFLNWVVYLGTQERRGTDATFAFVFVSIAVVTMAEALIWGLRGEAAAIASEDPR